VESDQPTTSDYDPGIMHNVFPMHLEWGVS